MALTQRNLSTAKPTTSTPKALTSTAKPASTQSKPVVATDAFQTSGPTTTKGLASDIASLPGDALDAFTEATGLTNKEEQRRLAEAQAASLAAMQQAGGVYEAYRPTQMAAHAAGKSNALSAYEGANTALAQLYGGTGQTTNFAPRPANYAPVTRPPGSAPRTFDTTWSQSPEEIGRAMRGPNSPLLRDPRNGMVPVSERMTAQDFQGPEFGAMLEKLIANMPAQTFTKPNVDVATQAFQDPNNPLLFNPKGNTVSAAERPSAAKASSGKTAAGLLKALGKGQAPTTASRPAAAPTGLTNTARR